ncbi:MAG: sensor histidine kinase, partial [Spirochaetes bacterium]
IHVAFQKKDNCILLTVEDDGVGRAKASEIEKGKKHKSIAMAITKERLGVFRKKFKKKFVLYITDLQDKAGRPIGTKIIVEIPFSIVR